MKLLNAERVSEIHDIILQEFGGLSGTCPDKSLEAVLNRANNHIFYNGLEDFFEIAALLGEAIAQGHVFNDGNKRTAFATVSEFLLLNNYILQAPDQEIVEMMVAIAEKSITRHAFAQWLQQQSRIFENPREVVDISLR